MRVDIGCGDVCARPLARAGARMRHVGTAAGECASERAHAQASCVCVCVCERAWKCACKCCPPRVVRERDGSCAGEYITRLVHPKTARIHRPCGRCRHICVRAHTYADARLCAYARVHSDNKKRRYEDTPTHARILAGDRFVEHTHARAHTCAHARIRPHVVESA